MQKIKNAQLEKDINIGFSFNILNNPELFLTLFWWNSLNVFQKLVRLYGVYLYCISPTLPFVPYNFIKLVYPWTFSMIEKYQLSIFFKYKTFPLTFILQSFIFFFLIVYFKYFFRFFPYVTIKFNISFNIWGHFLRLHLIWNIFFHP